MVPKVIEAKYKGNYTIALSFSDGVQGDVDFSRELYGEVFEPLKDLSLFKQFYIHPNFQTLCWPNGADFAPEFLYDQVRVPQKLHGK